MQKETSHKPEITFRVNTSILFNNNGDDKDAANCLISLKNSMLPQILRKIDDDYPSGSVIEGKPINKMPGFAEKEVASIIKMNIDNAVLNDSS